MHDEALPAWERKLLAFEPDAWVFDLLFAAAALFLVLVPGTHDRSAGAVLGGAALFALIGFVAGYCGRVLLERAIATKTHLVLAVLALGAGGAVLWSLALFIVVGTSPYALVIVAFETAVLVAWHAMHAMRRLRTLEASARDDALRRQLDPHFLSNVLNAIATLVDEGSPQAGPAFRQLAELLECVALSPRGLAPLSAELDAVRSFVALMTLRYEDELVVTFDVDPSLDARFPPLLLLSLVENAVKHGFRTTDLRPLEIAIHAHRLEGRTLYVAVRNTGRLGRAREQSIGHVNVEERLALLLPGRHTITLHEEDRSVVASLTLEGVCAP